MPFTILSRVNVSEKHDLDITALIYYENKLFSSSDDGKIKIWNENLVQIAQTHAHPCSIFSLAIGNDNLIYSCSNDGSVKAWSLQNLEPKFTLLQEQNEMWKLCFNNEKLYVGDDVGKVFIFNDNKMVGILEVMHPITDLLVLDNIVYTARDLYVIISEIHPEGKRIVTLQAIQGRAPVCVVGNKLCFASRSGKDILVHDNSRKTDFKPVGQVNDAHNMILNALLGVVVNGNKYLYSGGWDKVLKKWQIDETDNSLKLIDSCVVDFCITFLSIGPENTVYVGGDDGYIICIS